MLHRVAALETITSLLVSQLALLEPGFPADAILDGPSVSMEALPEVVVLSITTGTLEQPLAGEASNNPLDDRFGIGIEIGVGGPGRTVTETRTRAALIAQAITNTFRAQSLFTSALQTAWPQHRWVVISARCASGDGPTSSVFADQGARAYASLLLTLNIRES
jgi:hypothetical protein